MTGRGRKRKGSVEPGSEPKVRSLPTPQSYKEVQSLSASNLNQLCKSVGISTKYSKSARVNLLCLTLGISTSGSGHNKENQSPLVPRSSCHGLSQSQLHEFQSLTPSFLVALDSWSKELGQIPDLDEASVKRYLKDSLLLTANMARTYKLSRPYQLKQFIHSMRVNELPDHPTFIAVQAQCNPSQSTAGENVKL